MKPILLIAVLTLAGCWERAGHGQRCNPLRATNDCQGPYACVYPTAPSCGVSYCCLVDDAGAVIDPNPSCQPDPQSTAACLLDLSVVTSVAPDLAGID